MLTVAVLIRIVIPHESSALPEIHTNAEKVRAPISHNTTRRARRRTRAKSTMYELNMKSKIPSPKGRRLMSRHPPHPLQGRKLVAKFIPRPKVVLAL